MIGDLSPLTRKGVATASSDQFRFLPHGKSVGESALPSLVERVIHPQIQLMRLVKRISLMYLAVLIPVKPVGVAHTDVRLLKRHMKRNSRAEFNAKAAFVGPVL